MNKIICIILYVLVIVLPAKGVEGKYGDLSEEQLLLLLMHTNLEADIAFLDVANEADAHDYAKHMEVLAERLDFISKAIKRKNNPIPLHENKLYGDLIDGLTMQKFKHYKKLPLNIQRIIMDAQREFEVKRKDHQQTFEQFFPKKGND